MTFLGIVNETGDGSLTLLHPEHNEAYHSKGGARLEAEELYVKSSGIISDFESKFGTIRVLDVGLGLAYNACSTIQAWWKSPGEVNLFLQSLEINEELLNSFTKGLGEWQAGWTEAWMSWVHELKETSTEPSTRSWEARIPHPTGKGYCTWKIKLGCASNSFPILKETEQCWDYIWQDPFSPCKNPSMWTEAWFKQVACECSSKTVLMTYSVARVVKDALDEGGWKVEKIPAQGPKRSWLRAKPHVS